MGCRIKFTDFLQFLLNRTFTSLQFSLQFFHCLFDMCVSFWYVCNTLCYMCIFPSSSQRLLLLLLLYFYMCFQCFVFALCEQLQQCSLRENISIIYWYRLYSKIIMRISKKNRKQLFIAKWFCYIRLLYKFTLILYLCLFFEFQLDDINDAASRLYKTSCSKQKLSTFNICNTDIAFWSDGQISWRYQW